MGAGEYYDTFSTVVILLFLVYLVFPSKWKGKKEKLFFYPPRLTLIFYKCIWEGGEHTITL